VDDAERISDRISDLEIKLAYQDKLIRDLDGFIRSFIGRLDKAERELTELKNAARSPETPMGPANEPPPHY
jgi:uncharacterized coiled-coil protein SlyX